MSLSFPLWLPWLSICQTVLVKLLVSLGTDVVDCDPQFYAERTNQGRRPQVWIAFFTVAV